MFKCFNWSYFSRFVFSRFTIVNKKTDRREGRVLILIFYSSIRVYSMVRHGAGTATDRNLIRKKNEVNANLSKGANLFTIISKRDAMLDFSLKLDIFGLRNSGEYVIQELIPKFALLLKSCF